MSDALTDLNCKISTIEGERKILCARLHQIENALGDANIRRSTLVKTMAPETIVIDTQEQAQKIEQLAALRLFVFRVMVNRDTKTAFALCDHDETDSVPVKIDYDEAMNILKK